jgi:ABC-2 type transport system ATP-binding protein
VRHRSGVIADAVLRLNAADVGIDDIVVHRPTLDDVFLHLTGHRAEENPDERSEERAEEVAA